MGATSVDRLDSMNTSPSADRRTGGQADRRTGGQADQRFANRRAGHGESFRKTGLVQRRSRLQCKGQNLAIVGVIDKFGTPTLGVLHDIYLFLEIIIFSRVR